MHKTIGVCLGLFVLAALTGCQRQSYTEKDVHRAIAERQREAQVQIEREARVARPVEVENPPSGGASSQSGGVSSDMGGTNLPPPNRYDAPPPASQNMPTQPAPPPSVGDVRLEPRTGEYGIQPPGAPDTYTVPLNQQPQQTASPQLAPQPQQGQ
ncbi:MAG: hypothetical protein KatS3mg017_0618 [Fimbriimonadales bacterium]|nr:MAG: hypothetical protein KatS3mg017_0618 [Fimbriimonadales bacterium]